MTLKKLSNDDLISKTEAEIRSERETTLSIIKLFQEIYERRLYLERGFPSFYEMATKHFGYCAGSAMRRINAMKLVREMPQFEKQIESGDLSLSVASDVQSFFYHEAKIERAYSIEAKIELVETCVGKSRREVEAELVKRNPEREKRESVTMISDGRLRINLSISTELNEKLTHLKDLLSHAEPNLSTESLLERLVELGLEKFDPRRKAARAKHRSRSSNTTFKQNKKEENLAVDAATSTAKLKRSRYIPAAEKHNVFSDEAGCTYVSADGRRCGSRKFLQLDHVEPFAKGGPHVADNLRWMCGAHNRLRNNQTHECASTHADSTDVLGAPFATVKAYGVASVCSCEQIEVRADTGEQTEKPSRAQNSEQPASARNLRCRHDHLPA